MDLLRAAKSSARASVTLPPPPLKSPLRASSASVGGGLAAPPGSARPGVAARLRGDTATLSTALSGFSHGSNGARGACACVAFAVAGVATRLAISGA